MLNTSGDVFLNGSPSTFDISTLTASSLTIRNLSSSVPGCTVNLGDKNLTFGGIGITLFEGSITGTALGSIIKQNPSLVILTGASTYGGGTTINGGIIQLSGSGSLSSSGFVNVNSASSIFDITFHSSPGTAIGDLISTFPSSSVVLGPNILTFGTGNNTTFAGSITGGASAALQSKARAR